MAENKKSFILYADLISIVEKLIIQDRDNKTNYSGELFYHILQYVNDRDPIPVDFIIDMTFEPIKLQLKRDLQKWEANVEQRRQAGLRSAEVRRNKTNEMQHSLTTVQRNATNPTVTVNVNDTVNVKKEDKIGKIQEKFYNTLIPFVDKFGKDEIRNFYEYWSEPNKSKTKIRFQLEKTWDTKRRLQRWSKNNFKQNGETKRKDEGFKKEFFIHRAED